MISTIILTLLLTYLVLHKLIATGGFLLDIPNERSSHVRPTARGGGFVILIGMILGIIIGISDLDSVRFSDPSFNKGIIVTLSAICAGIIGLWDDIKGLSAKYRLILYSLLAGVVVSNGLTWHSFPIGGSIEVDSWILTCGLTLLWIVWGANFYNFMDGINGIALGQAISTGLFYLIIAATLGFNFLTSILASIVGFCCLVLPFNFPKAKIFLGDVGSISLGFFFAACPIIVGEALPKFNIWLAILAIFPFFGDSVITLLRRIWMREKLSNAHRSHCYQVLADRWGHAPITITYTVISVLINILILTSILGFLKIGVTIAAVVALFIGLIFCTVQISYARKQMEN